MAQFSHQDLIDELNFVIGERRADINRIGRERKEKPEIKAYRIGICEQMLARTIAARDALRSLGPVATGERHTLILATIHEELQAQFPDAFHEEDDSRLVIPTGKTPQTAFVVVDTSALAEQLVGALSLGSGAS